MRACFICGEERCCGHREDGLRKFYADSPEAESIKSVVAESESAVSLRKPVQVQERSGEIHQKAVAGAIPFDRIDASKHRKQLLYRR